MYRSVQGSECTLHMDLAKYRSYVAASEPVAHVVVCGHCLWVVVHHDGLLAQSPQLLYNGNVERYY